MRTISLRTLRAHHEGIGERETHGGGTVSKDTAARGTNKSDFCTRAVGEAGDVRNARVVGLGAAL